MRLNEKQLIRLPVETASGDRLGTVAGFSFDPFDQRIMQYKVRPHATVAKLLGDTLLVSYDQVVSITAEKMTVEDAVRRDAETEKTKGAQPASSEGAGAS